MLYTVITVYSYNYDAVSVNRLPPGSTRVKLTKYPQLPARGRVDSFIHLLSAIWGNSAKGGGNPLLLESRLVIRVHL